MGLFFFFFCFCFSGEKNPREIAFTEDERKHIKRIERKSKRERERESYYYFTVGPFDIVLILLLSLLNRTLERVHYVRDPVII